MEQNFFAKAVCKAISFVGLGLLKLRYRVEVKKALCTQDLDPKKGILFLPNHVALIDPLFFFFLFGLPLQVRPVALEFVMHIPVLGSIMRLLNVVEIPDFDNSVNQVKIRKANQVFKAVGAGLRNGERYVVYPGARLKAEGRELLHGSSGIQRLLEECPDVQIVLVRFTGFWGSSFSRALIGKTPDIASVVWEGFKALWKNVLFFTPRRRLVVETEVNPKDFPRKGSRLEINRYLENWYNQYPTKTGDRKVSEPLQLVSYNVWTRKLPTPFQRAVKKGLKSGAITEETKNQVYGILRKILKDPHCKILPEMSLGADLGLDSLNMADLSTYLLSRYNIPDFAEHELQTVSDLLALATDSFPLKDKASLEPGVYRFSKEPNRPDPRVAKGENIVDAFLQAMDEFSPFTACGDDALGPITYKKFRRSVLVLSEYFRTLPEERIGVLLPASSAAFLIIFSLQLAGKVPVMLNWTVGPYYLDEMVRISQIKRAVSSWKFIDRLPNVDFGKISDQLLFLEDIRKELTLKMKLRGLALSWLKTKWLKRYLKVEKIDPRSTCVMLFTSGTEACPKCVPLSHINVLTTVQANMEPIEKWVAKDVLYAILPPFHSFGFVSAGLFPLLSGVRVAFYPDPTNGLALAEGIERWKVTAFPSAPSFLKRMMQVAKQEKLKTVRLYITGGEKLSTEFQNYILSQGADVIEGYGVTECASAITGQTQGFPRRGVGFLLRSYKGRTIHPETGLPLPEGAEGEICLRGPAVFYGYFGPGKSPFIEIDGLSWYRTGDIGWIEQDRTVFISGRLKRFTKIGGEMISLSAIEAALLPDLLAQGKATPDRQVIAVCADESAEDGTKLVLFSTIPLEKEKLNEQLRKAGFSNLIKISSVIQVEEIPLLATGKTNHRQLQELLTSEKN